MYPLAGDKIPTIVHWLNEREVADKGDITLAIERASAIIDDKLLNAAKHLCIDEEDLRCFLRGTWDDIYMSSHFGVWN